MIDLDNLSKEEKIFQKEFKIFNDSKNIVKNAPSDIALFKSSLNSLTDEYLHLLKQTVKLVKISDNNQLKLRNAQIQLKEQKDLIESQNIELTKSNQNQEILLNIINKELSKAADYVRSLLPKPIINGRNGLNICWKFVPSSKLGGDMFGYKMHDSEHLIFFLFDVCGHGIGPALYSVSVFNAINNQNLIHVDFLSPASVFRGLNKVFNMRAHNDLYFTMWYGVLNLSNYKLTFSSAGHPPSIIISNTKNNQLPICENFFIGGVPNYEYIESTHFMEKGDSIYIFSDGVYEIRKNEKEYFTIEELENFIQQNNDNPNILDNIYDHLNWINFDPVLEDDFSILKISI